MSGVGVWNVYHEYQQYELLKGREDWRSSNWGKLKELGNSILGK